MIYKNKILKKSHDTVHSNNFTEDSSQTKWSPTQSFYEAQIFEYNSEPDYILCRKKFLKIIRKLY